MLTNCLMFQGCTSDAGKSFMTAAFGRILSNNQISVAPFKPQNMSLNSAVTVDGGEIGRAQALQAQACRQPPVIDFNPVLLKPNTDIGAQIILHGKAVTDMNAQAYHQYKPVAMQAVLDSFARLQKQFDFIVIEGAGSPAEINLRDKDIANMGFAEVVDCPVVLVADIDRGGVFAHFIGTLACLSESEQARIVGFVINKFRGDVALLEPGIEWLEQKTGIPVLAVVPYQMNLKIDAEDGINHQQNFSSNKVKICVPVFSRMSNHTDFEVLQLHPDINFQYVLHSQSIPPCDLIILPGSKSVRSDLQLLKDNGWDHDIQKHLRYGGKLIGICGGFQMLGQMIHDPGGIEGHKGSSQALGYFNFETYLAQEKQLRRIYGSITLAGMKKDFKGYEIHAGVSEGQAMSIPLLEYKDDQGNVFADGVIHQDNNIIGCYCHGLFDEVGALSLVLNWVKEQSYESVDRNEVREAQLNRMAKTVRNSLRADKLPEKIKFLLNLNT